MQITHSENNYAEITQKLRNVLGNAPFYQNYAKITQITQVPKDYADYATPTVTLLMPCQWHWHARALAHPGRDMHQSDARAYTVTTVAGRAHWYYGGMAVSP